MKMRCAMLSRFARYDKLHRLLRKCDTMIIESSYATLFTTMALVSLLRIGQPTLGLWSTTAGQASGNCTGSDPTFSHSASTAHLAILDYSDPPLPSARTCAASRTSSF